MKTYATIHRYLFFELIPPFVINLVFFTFIFLMTKILEIANYIVNYQVGFGKVLLLLMYNMPYFLTFVIPMSVMMAVLLTFLRLSGDNEIIALRSSGVSLYGLLPPVLLFCVIGCGITAAVTIYGTPWGYLSIRTMGRDLAAANLNIGLTERMFNNTFEGVTLYVNKVDPKTNGLKDIFIEDQRDVKMKSSIIAPKGSLLSDPKTMTAYLRLFDGMINQVNLKNKTVNTISFETYMLTLSLKSEKNTAQKEKSTNEKSMTVGELKTVIQNTDEKDNKHYKYRIELQNKFSIPAACMTLGLLAVPLGVQAKARRQSYGLGLGMFFFLLFYLLLSMGWVLGKSGFYPPEIGIWVPNLVMGIMAVVFWVMTVKEGSMNFFSRIDAAFKKIRFQK
jgi:lipopolysaccharide export system permease protein